ncbi:dTDP-4-dehydrorhamnose reductase [Butyrivibrio sp. NC3005]|uniref:dTDP-4-dehydrorhamnose reductase n=1 Tax=Butyrivibrio sp. NC3005 TaxID=1280685 RepID=UPI000407424F|nr:dTDP-4-dehydrorhamnose reductase [Butyrivibrio sp. NC3005]
MKKIIVTGSNGQLGRQINIELGSEYELVNTDVVEGEGIRSLDITNVDSVLELAREVKPYAIINCAAYTAVDAQEKDRDLSYKINAIGPRNLAIASTEVDAKLVHISTDYVFEGNGTRPYTEFDKTGPVSAYGTTKLAGEKFVEQFAKHFFTIRTAWLYGDGKNFVKTMLKLSENHDEVSVVNDQVGSPTSTTELAKAIHFLLPSDNYGLFHGTCEGDCSWAEFTDEIFRLAGKSTKVNHVTTAQYKEMNPQSAPRPAYSILDNYMLRLTSDYKFADWHDAIDEYIRKMK